MLATCESADQIDATAVRLPAGTPIVAHIESALGIEHAYAIAIAAGTRRLALIGGGVVRRNSSAKYDPPRLAHHRSRLVVASRAAALPGPIDGPTIPDGAITLMTDLDDDNQLGVTAKLCTRTHDAPVINRAFRPSSREIAWAAIIINEHSDDGKRVGDGSDLFTLAHARRITHLAKVYNDH